MKRILIVVAVALSLGSIAYAQAPVIQGSDAQLQTPAGLQASPVSLQAGEACWQNCHQPQLQP